MFERRIEFSHAKDWRKPEPHRDFGHIGMKITFYIIGDKGAVQWVISPNWYVASTREAWAHLPADYFKRDAARKPEAWDLGYHSREPRYEDHRAMKQCHLLGGKCYYDGSTSNADSLVEGFIAGGVEWLWPKLEAYYRSVFDDADYPDFTPVYDPHPDDRVSQ